MRLSLALCLFPVLLAGAPLSAQTEADTALGALRLLPRADSKRLARIVGRDGTPVPERWHFIVHDPKAETGVREYVVAKGEIVASRDVSQFAENLRAGEVFGGDVLKVNSDRAARLALQYAQANNLTVAVMNYELKKEGSAAAALWSVTCLDDDGKEIGHLVVSAGKGSVVSHDGFPIEPPPPPPPPPRPPPPPTVPTPEDRLRRPAADLLGEKPAPAPLIGTDPFAPQPIPAATPEPKKPGLLDRVGSGLQKVFTTRGRQKRPE